MGYSAEVSSAISLLNTEDASKVLFVFLQIHNLSTGERQTAVLSVAATGVADRKQLLLRSQSKAERFDCTIFPRLTVKCMKNASNLDLMPVKRQALQLMKTKTF